MKLSNQLFVAIVLQLFCFFFSRHFFYGLKRFLYNNSAYKKRKKGGNFCEWLLYKRWDRFPKIWLIIYYILNLTHLVVIILCICVYLLGRGYIGEAVVRAMVYFDTFGGIAVLVLLWDPKNGGNKYSRWIDTRKH